MTTRYDQLLTLIDQYKPGVIIEVGVHRAVRAVAMCTRALKHRKTVDYIGFDVFETMGKDFQEAALNGKGMPTEAQARYAMRRAQNVAPASRRSLGFQFVVGDTRLTLHGKPHGGAGTLAFIDGDHRIECIREDYQALRHCDVVVFDDYYCPDRTGTTVDLQKYGANAVVAELEALDGVKVEILPAADPCKHGGVIRLAVVTRPAA